MINIRSARRSFGHSTRAALAVATGAFPAALRRPSVPRILLQQPHILTHIHKRTMASAVAKRLEGKTIVITGASSGIGYSTAKEFARTSPKNLKIIATARRVDRLEQLAKEIKEEVGDGVKVLPVALDVADPQAVKNFVPSLPAEFQDIDVLVNNA
jgi:3-hydroxy acid dehydrogenase / malonic semialdehyde reductase